MEEVSNGCTCVADGTAIKSTNTSKRALCIHTSLVGTFPLIRKYWSIENKLDPSQMYGSSGLNVYLICSHCNTSNARRPNNMAVVKTFKCESCKKTNLLADKPNSICDCLEKGLAKMTKGKGYICSHNNLQAMCPIVVDFWSSKNSKAPNLVSPKASTNVILICPVCHVEESKKVSTLTKNGTYECASCELAKDNLLLRIPYILNFWDASNVFHPSKLSPGSAKVVVLKCPTCSTIENMRVYSLYKNGNYKCDKCISAAITHPHLIEEVNDGTDLTKLTHGSVVVIEWKCKTCSYIWKCKLSSRAHGENSVRKSTGCKRCARLIPLTYEEFKRRILEEFGNKYTYPDEFPDFKLLTAVVPSVCSEHGEILKLATLHLKSPCGQCVRPKSKLCTAFEKELVKRGIPYKAEVTISGMIYEGNLSIDYLFQSESGNWYAVECDGHQHFRLSRWDKETDHVELRQRRDIAKDQFCVNNGISMMRIPYNMKNQIPKLIDGFLIMIKSGIPFIYTYARYRAQINLPSIVAYYEAKSPNTHIVL